MPTPDEALFGVFGLQGKAMETALKHDQAIRDGAREAEMFGHPPASPRKDPLTSTQRMRRTDIAVRLLAGWAAGRQHQPIEVKSIQSEIRNAFAQAEMILELEEEEP